VFVSTTSAHDGAVEDLDYDGHHHRLASVGKGSVQVWNINDDHMDGGLLH